MNFDAPLYADFHELQRQGDKQFLQEFVPLMTWNKGSDVIMDVGCGPGDITRQFLLLLHPEVETIIGIDVSPDMIRLAKAQNSNPKISYHVADIADDSSLKSWHGKISHVVSMFCLHWVGNQKIAFRNIYNLLCDNGEAILLFAINSPIFVDALINFRNSQKWEDLTKNIILTVPESQFKQDSTSYYKSMLEEIGFLVISLEEEEQRFTFENKDVAKETLAGICAFTTYILEELRNDFKEDLFDYIVKQCGSDAQGRLTFKDRSLKVHLRKPKI